MREILFRGKRIDNGDRRVTDEQSGADQHPT